MKSTNSFIVLLILLSVSLQAQSLRPQTKGGGEYELGHGECISPSERAAMEAELAANVAMLRASGKLPEANEKSMITLDWPLQQAAGFNYNSYYSVGQFVDHNPASPNGLLDWNCGTRTYDTNTGYNHTGTDIGIWPFSWCMVDDEQVEVIAAAAGTIVFKADGNFDRECTFSNNPANAIILQHTDGSRTLYWHMKNASLTAKGVGSTVAAGEYLGIVASSGSSTGPHLHFEVEDNTGALIDPYGGPCNSLNGTTSWWTNQKPYFETTINAVLTHSATPQFNTCPAPADKFLENCFEPGDLGYFAVYLHDQQPGQTMNIRIYRPSGALYVTTSITFTNYFSASWWWWSYFLPSTPSFTDLGTWTFEATLQGNTVTHQFELSNDCDIVEIQASALLQGPLNAGTSIMSTALNSGGLLSTTDPYGLGETVASMPTNVVDWVLVELRDATTPTTVLGQRAALLRNDGVILDPNDGTTTLKFSGITASTGHVVVKHRNHLGMMTNTPVSF